MSPVSASGEEADLARLMPSSGALAGRASSAARRKVPSPPNAKTTRHLGRGRTLDRRPRPRQLEIGDLSAMTRTSKPPPQIQRPGPSVLRALPATGVSDQ